MNQKNYEKFAKFIAKNCEAGHRGNNGGIWVENCLRDLNLLTDGRCGIFTKLGNYNNFMPSSLNLTPDYDKSHRIEDAPLTKEAAKLFYGTSILAEVGHALNKDGELCPIIMDAKIFDLIVSTAKITGVYASTPFSPIFFETDDENVAFVAMPMRLDKSEVKPLRSVGEVIVDGETLNEKDIKAIFKSTKRWEVDYHFKSADEFLINYNRLTESKPLTEHETFMTYARIYLEERKAKDERSQVLANAFAC